MNIQNYKLTNELTTEQARQDIWEVILEDEEKERAGLEANLKQQYIQLLALYTVIRATGMLVKAIILVFAVIGVSSVFGLTGDISIDNAAFQSRLHQNNGKH